jgi:NitT/TauT family transport system substrate-binding protein
MSRLKAPWSFFASLVVLVFFANGASAAEKIAIGYGMTNDFLPVFIANDEGMFAKHGLAPHLVVVTSSSLSPPALVGGSLNVAQMTPSNMLLANDGGLDLVAIAGVGRNKITNPRSGLITRKDLIVKKPQDLIGKTVAVPGFNAGMDLVLRKWLIDGGVQISQVRIVEAPFAQMGGQLQSGQIDAAFEIDPIMARILNAHEANKSIDLLGWATPDMLATLWGADRKWATAHRGEVRAFVASLADAISFMKEHPDKAHQIEKKYLSYSVPDMPDVSLGITPKDIEFWVGVCDETGVLHTKLDPKSLIFK